MIVEGMAAIEDPRERARDRILDDREIRLMFAACGRLDLRQHVQGHALHGSAPDEVATMRFDDIDDGLWTIPKESVRRATRND